MKEDNPAKDDAVEMTPAENWSKIVELAKAIELGAQDLQDLQDQFKKIK